MDYLKVVLIGGGIAAGVALLATFTVVAANLGSKSLVLAASTLMAATILVCVQMFFELQGLVNGQERGGGGDALRALSVNASSTC